MITLLICINKNNDNRYMKVNITRYYITKGIIYFK